MKLDDVIADLTPPPTHVFASICRSYLQKCNTFKVGTLQAKLNTLNESSTFKGKCAVNAENFICELYTGPLINMTFFP